MARPKGAVNKTTRDVREFIAKAAARYAPNIEPLLERIAAEDPARAFDLYLRMIEYHIPKLGRLEHTGKDGGAVAIDFSVDLSKKA